MNIEKVFKVIFILSAAIFIGKFSKRQTDGFTILGISSNRTHVEEFETRDLTAVEKEEVKKALHQPYHYFGSGAQAFVFFSADGKYVIKFFKQRLFRPSFLLKYFPLPNRAKLIQKRGEKWLRDFFSYKIAFEDLQEETGVLYTHLNKTKHLKTQLEIKDRLGIRHVLDLDEFDFIVQVQGEKVYDCIQRLMKEEQIEETKKAISQVFEFISKRSLKGYHDRDPNIEMNCGFYENKAIKMDVGRFVLDETMKTVEGHNRELLENTAPFEKWIHNKYPELLSSYHELLHQALLK